MDGSDDLDVATDVAANLNDLEYLSGEAPVLAAVLDRMASRAPIDDIVALAA